MGRDHLFAFSVVSHEARRIVADASAVNASKRAYREKLVTKSVGVPYVANFTIVRSQEELFDFQKTLENTKNGSVMLVKRVVPEQALP